MKTAINKYFVYVNEMLECIGTDYNYLQLFNSPCEKWYSLISMHL